MTQPEELALFIEEVEEGAHGELRVSNLPTGTPNRHERRSIIDRQRDLYVGANLVAVVHGYTEDHRAPATLVVLDFEVSDAKCAFELASTLKAPLASSVARFKRATINVSFRDSENTVGEGPWVTQFSPSGRLSLNPTPKHVEVKKAVDTGFQGGGGPASGSVGVVYEKTISQDESDRVTLTGKSVFEGIAQGEKRKVSWTLSENGSQKSGLPSYLRALILLSRDDDRDFVADVQVETKVDWKSSVKTFLSKQDKDDPVIFKPTMPRDYEWQQQHQVDAENLQSTNLDAFSVVLDYKMPSSGSGEIDHPK